MKVRALLAKMSLVLGSLLLGLSVNLQADNIETTSTGPSSEALSEITAIAREAFIYAYPMLYNYKTLQEQTQDQFSPAYVGGFGRFRHYSKTYTPADTDIVTPNNDTPYSWAWLDLRAEPWVLSVPELSEDRYNVFQWFDLYTHNFAYIGVRATGYKAGSYLFAGPHWNGEVPENISKVFRSETELVGTLTRTGTSGPDDTASVQAIQRKYVLQPLSEFAGGRAAAPAAQIYWPSWNEERALSAEFISYLNFFLQFTASHESEKQLLQRFATIGIEPGRSFDLAGLPKNIRDAIQAGVAEGLRDLDEEAEKVTGSSGLFGSREAMQNDYMKRALGAKMGIYGNSIEEAVYSTWPTDSEGQPLDGKRQYEIRFEAGQLPPVKLFWSVTMYNLPQRLLADNKINRYSIGDRTPGFKPAEDGSITIYVQNASPEGEKKANWLPAPAGPFFIVGRFYGPDETLMDGSYKVPAIQLIK